MRNHGVRRDPYLESEAPKSTARGGVNTLIDDGALPLFMLHGQPQRRDQIIVAADFEGAIALVGVLAHANLIIKEFTRQDVGLARLGSLRSPISPASAPAHGYLIRTSVYRERAIRRDGRAPVFDADKR